MPRVTDLPTGAPCWVDLYTSDPARSRAFYGELFGWVAEEAGEEYGGYVNFLRDGEPIAGCMHNDGSSGTPDVWSVYLVAADAKETVDVAAAHGAQVIAPAMDVGDLGTMAVLTDPSGAAVGIWQPGEHRGFSVLGEPGAPAWFELHTHGYDAAVDFYRSVFGWDTHVMADAPGFRYTTLGAGDAQRAGIMDETVFGTDGPSCWAVYFHVPEVDATVARVVDLGGAVVEAPTDSPYGRLAVVEDPTGARFRLQAG